MKEIGRRGRDMELVLARESVGVCEYADGSKYNGEWVDDLKNGKGVYEYPNGDKYSGDWVDDARNGKGRARGILGCLEYADGRKYDGPWKDDKIVGGRRH